MHNNRGQTDPIDSHPAERGTFVRCERPDSGEGVSCFSEERESENGDARVWL